MDLQKHLRFLLVLVYAALAAAALTILLPGLLPFLLALGLAWMLEGPVRLLSEKVKLRRPWAAALVMVVFTLLVLGGCAVLLRRLWYELALLSSRLPALLESFQALSSWLEEQLYRLSVAVPPSARAALEAALESAAEQIGTLLSGLSARVLNWTAGAVSALPSAVLFLFTTLLACFFILAGRPALFAFFRRQIPERWLPRLEQTAARLKSALGGWLRAQGILMGVTFLLLAAGFLLMGVDLALLLAAGVALLDALPVFGTGTVLFPWAAAELLSGNFRRAAALLVLYAVIWLTRSLLEPKLVADRAGLHPLAALVSMYLGFTLFGVAGMLLAPLAVVVLRQLHDSGVLKLWK
ncbi:MAG: sporulation integral membrane protein YtvI [Oscillospiraceae bacterium]